MNNLKLEPMTTVAPEVGDCLPTLDAGRVRLRWLTETDVPALFAIFGDPEVIRYWGQAVLPDMAAAGLLLEVIRREFRAGHLSSGECRQPMDA